MFTALSDLPKVFKSRAILQPSFSAILYIVITSPQETQSDLIEQVSMNKRRALVSYVAPEALQVCFVCRLSATTEVAALKINLFFLCLYIYDRQDDWNHPPHLYITYKAAASWCYLSLA